jgi:hypothetical protein
MEVQLSTISPPHGKDDALGVEVEKNYRSGIVIVKGS